MSLSFSNSTLKKKILHVLVPCIKFRKIIEAEEDILIWNIKQQLIEEIGKNLKCPINYGLYFTSSISKEGMFLDEWKRLNYYEIDNVMATLEFKPKIRTGVKRKKIMNNDLSLLFIYINNNNIDVIQKMILDGFDPNVIDSKTGETPLTFCSQIGAINLLIREFYESGAFLDYRNLQSLSPLHKAAQYNNLNTVKTLINLGSSTLIRDSSNLTPLFHAIKNSSSIELIKYLLDNGSPIDCVDFNGNTELHMACIEQSVQVVALLIHYGAEINSVNNYGNTCLHICVLNDKIKSLAYLTRKGINFTSVNSDMMTALMLAQSLGKDEFVKLLSFVEKDKSFSINMKNSVIHANNLKEDSIFKNNSIFTQMSIGKSRSSIFSKKLRQLKYSITSISSMNISENYLQNIDSERTYKTKTICFSRKGHKLGIILRGNSKKKKIEDLGSGMVSIPSFNYIESVVKNSEEDKAGFKDNDFILEINGIDVRCFPKSKVKSLFSCRNKVQTYKIASLNISSKKQNHDFGKLCSKDCSLETEFELDDKEIIPPPFEFSVNSKDFLTSTKKLEKYSSFDDSSQNFDSTNQVELPKIVKLTQRVNPKLMHELKSKLKQRNENKLNELKAKLKQRNENKLNKSSDSLEEIPENDIFMRKSAVFPLSKEDDTASILLKRANEIISQYKNSKKEIPTNSENNKSAILPDQQKSLKIRENLFRKYGIDPNTLISSNHQEDIL